MIEWKEKSEKPAFAFGTLKLTDTFVLMFDADEIFMKIEEYENDSGFFTNAVSLKKGTSHGFNDKQIVTPVDVVVEYSLRK